MSLRAGMALPLLGLLFMGVGWGGNMMLAKLATGLGAPPVGLAFMEAFGSGILLLLVIWAQRRRLPVDGRNLRFYCISGAVGVAVPNAITFYAARHLSVGLLALLMTLVPLVTYGFSLLLGLERFWRVRALGLIFGLLGMVLILAPSASLPDPALYGWVLIALTAPALYALQNVYVAHAWPEDGDALALSCGGLLASGIMLAPVALFTGGFIDLTGGWSWVQWSGSIMMAVNAILTVIFIASLRGVGPVFTSQTAYLITIAGVLWGIFLFHEHHSAWIWSSMVVMCAGVALVTRQQRPAPA